MAKRLGLLIGVLVVLLGIGAYLWIFGRPGESRENPIPKAQADKISRIAIKSPPNAVELERTGTTWRLTAPVRDLADPIAVGEMVAGLQSFTLGSVVSENASKHGQFKVDPAQAAHVQAYVEANPKPVLDGYVGKSATAIDSSYFRFEGSTRVYVANDLPDYAFRREPKALRQAHLLPDSIQGATAIKVIQEKSTLDLVRSSDTWSRRRSDKKMDAAVVRPLLNKLEELSAADFGAGAESADALGLAKPYVQFDVEVGTRTASFAVGKKAPAPFPKAPPLRYAKTAGRDAVLLVRDDTISDLLASLKTLP